MRGGLAGLQRGDIAFQRHDQALGQRDQPFDARRVLQLGGSLRCRGCLLMLEQFGLHRAGQAEAAALFDAACHIRRPSGSGTFPRPGRRR